MRLLLPSSPELLHLQRLRRRDCGGLRYGDLHLTFADLATAAEAAAAWLQRRGIGAGDHVAIIAGNTPALVAWQFGAWSLSAVAVPIGPRSTTADASTVADHARCRIVVADTDRAELARAVAAELGLPAGIASSAAQPLAPTALRRGNAIVAHAPRPPRPADLAVLAYTSGTTGTAKGVMLSHANLLWSALACSSARADQADGVGICLSPLTHTPVFVSHLLCRILTGQTAVLVEKFDVDSLLDIVSRNRVTDLPLIAGMVFSIVERGRVPDAVRKSIAKVSVGGAATPMDAKRALAEIFPKADVFEAYGQSESTDGVTMARHGSVFAKPGTIGRANPYVAVDVLRSDDSLAEVDEPGEIAIAGPTVMRGYYRDRKATAAALRNGWLRTGDLGRRDGDGDLFLTGRAKELIITGGENVSPVEVENVLRRHPDVADVAVLGTPHPRWGEQVTAVVVAAQGAALDARALDAFARAHLAGFKKPRRIEFVDALPRNAANKVQTSVLRDRLSRKV